MWKGLESEGIRRLAGLATWAAAGVPIATSWRASSAPATSLSVAAAAYAAFGFAFLVMTMARKEPTSLRFRVTFLAIQTAAALVMATVLGNGFEGIFLVLVAAQLAYCLPLPRALLWSLGQTLAYMAISLFHHRDPVTSAVVTVAYAGFQAFAIHTAHVALREAAQRVELTRLNAELKSTQALLAESSRLAERARIARELHDLLGHHLTALSLALEVAAHVTEGRGREEVERARSIAKLLLADVRGVVSQFRENGDVDLPRALRVLAAGIPRPEIRLELDPSLTIGDPALAEALLRCVQEIVTNAVKHSGARVLTVEMKAVDSRLQLRARDDGHGAPAVAPGHGLTGLKERVAEMDGTIELVTAPGEGFRVAIEIPFPEGAR